MTNGNRTDKWRIQIQTGQTDRFNVGALVLTNQTGLQARMRISLNKSNKADRQVKISPNVKSAMTGKE